MFQPEQIYLYGATAAVLHNDADMSRLIAGPNERHHVVMIQLLQLHHQSRI